MEKVRQVIYKYGSFLIVVIVNLVGVFFLDTLTISDEIGTISNIAYLFGYDWSEAFGIYNANYYKYGQALLYFPAFLVSKDPFVIYKICLVINAIIISLIPLIVNSILQRIYALDRKISLLISTSVGLMPLYTLWSKYVWAESLLSIIPWVIILFLFQNSKEESQKIFNIRSGCLAMVQVYAYMTHSRGVVIMIAAIITCFLLHFLWKMRLVNWKVYISFTMIFLAVDYFMSSWLKRHIWINDGNNNSIGGIIERLQNSNMDLFVACKALIKMVLGWLYNCCCSTYGLGIVGIVICFVYIYRAHRTQKFNNFTCILTVFSLLLFLGSFLLGMIFFVDVPYQMIYEGQRERFDKMIYGRYIAPSIGLLVLVAFIDIIKAKSGITYKKRKMILGFIGVIAMNFILYLSDLVEGNSFAINQLETLPLFIQKSRTVIYKENAETIFVICSFLVLVTIFVIFFLLVSNSIDWICIITICLYLITYMWQLNFYMIPSNDYYKDNVIETKNIIQIMESKGIRVDRIYTNIDRGFYCYQFEFMEKEVLPLKFAKVEEEFMVIDDDIRKEYRNNNYYLIYVEEKKTNMFIKGERLAKKIKDSGIEIQKIQ